jgi:hypothetical protein
MAVHVPRSGFSLDLLIREAKERARRRRLVFLAVVLVIAAGATGAALFLSGAASGRPASSPFASIEGFQGSNSTILAGSSANVLRINFHPNARFAVGLELPNLSDRTVIVTDARLVEPRRSVIRQTGTSLLHWYVPPPRPCSFDCVSAEGFTFQPVTATAPPRPLVVKPGRGEWQLGVQIDYRIGSCAVLSSPRSPSPSRMVVSFHVPRGPAEHETISLGGLKPQLHRPKVLPPACKQP